MGGLLQDDGPGLRRALQDLRRLRGRLWALRGLGGSLEPQPEHGLGTGAARVGVGWCLGMNPGLGPLKETSWMVEGVIQILIHQVGVEKNENRSAALNDHG